MSDEAGLPAPVPIPSPGVPLYFGAAGRPLVVLVHDYFGRLPWLGQYAEALAHVGFRVVIPDLYSGVATVNPRVAESLMAQLDVATSLALIDEVIEDARAEGTRRFATVGFSMGGWLALLHAQGGATDAVVAYYATLRPAEHGVIPCPVLLNFAESDEWEDGADPESFVGRLKDHGTPVTDHSYIATGHGFANASVAAGFSAAAAAFAYARTAAFLESELAD
jgi:carboxymethylenebutenolidase